MLYNYSCCDIVTVTIKLISCNYVPLSEFSAHLNFLVILSSHIVCIQAESAGQTNNYRMYLVFTLHINLLVRPGRSQLVRVADN